MASNAPITGAPPRTPIMPNVSRGGPLATAAAAPLQATWNTALSAYTEAKAAEDTFSRRHTGHVDRFPVGDLRRNTAVDEVPDHIWEQIKALGETRCRLEEELIFTPAPSLAGVILKIEIARVRWADFQGWPESWWVAVMSDLRRLNAGGR